MNADATHEKHLSHHISVVAREAMEIHGVNDVVSFDEQAVILNTACGGMSVEGNALHVRVLNVEQGIVTLDGHIDSIVYFDRSTDEKAEKGRFFGRMFC
jgi:sporulation protein YabP